MSTDRKLLQSLFLHRITSPAPVDAHRTAKRTARHARHARHPWHRLLTTPLLALLLVVGCAPDSDAATTPEPASATTVTTPQATAASAAELITEPDEGSCTVRVQGLNLRRGPGTNYTPALTSLNSGAALRSIARNADSTWVQVVVVATGRQGWVAAGSQYINCTTAVRNLPLASNIPAPSANTPATNAPLAFVILPAGPGQRPEGMQGSLQATTGFTISPTRDENNREVAVFSNRFRIMMQVDALPDDRTVGNVNFFVNYASESDPDETFVHEYNEESAPYCLFGRVGQNCNFLELGAGARWPATNLLVTNGRYVVGASIDLLDDDGNIADSAFWSSTIEIRNNALPAAPATTTTTQPETETPPPTTSQVFVILPPGPGGGPSDLTGDLVAGEDDVTVYVNEFGSTIMSFTDRIWLRMEVDSVPADTEVRDVEFTFIADSDLTEVNRQVESTAGYCSFGGGEPDCNVLELRPGAVWPGTGIEITNGFYLFSARVTVENTEEETTSSRSWGGIIEIDNDDLPPDPGREEEETGTTIPEAPTEEQGDQVQDLVVNLRETAPGTTSDFIADALAFRVEAYDPTVGANDGDGIDNVLLQVWDGNGTLVHERTEGTAGYCAFSGGEPDCVAYNFDDNGYAWPSGDGIFSGDELTLSAFVTADDGRTTALDWFITIE